MPKATSSDTLRLHHSTWVMRSYEALQGFSRFWMSPDQARRTTRERQRGDINSAGTIVGNYSDANNAIHGYLRSPDGTFTTIDAPNAFQGANSPGTFITHINARGAIVGYYFDAQGTRHGFVRE